MFSVPIDEETVIAAGREALNRLRRNVTWTDWKIVGAALAIGRDRALRIAGTRRPFGKPYVRTFSAWLRQHGFHDAICRRSPDTRCRSGALRRAPRRTKPGQKCQLG